MKGKSIVRDERAGRKNKNLSSESRKAPTFMRLRPMETGASNVEAFVHLVQLRHRGARLSQN